MLQYPQYACQIESEDEIVRRIEAAGLSHDGQWHKLDLVVRVAQKVWGTAH